MPTHAPRPRRSCNRRSGRARPCVRAWLSQPSAPGRARDQGRYDGWLIEAPIVVVMAGPWSDQFLTHGRYRLSLDAAAGADRLLSSTAAAVAWAYGLHRRCPRRLFPPAWRRASTLIGVGRWKPEPPPDPDHYNEANDPDFIPAAKAKAARRIPDLQRAEYARGHAGIYDVSPDSRAILDRAPGIEGLYMAAGFSGTGFKISPAVGACMAELMTQGQATFVDITPFRFSRFGESADLWSDEYDLPEDFGHRVWLSRHVFRRGWTAQLHERSRRDPHRDRRSSASAFQNFSLMQTNALQNPMDRAHHCGAGGLCQCHSAMTSVPPMLPTLTHLFEPT